MGKVVIKSEFHSDCDFQFKIEDNELVSIDSDDYNRYLCASEIPEFIIWLQSEYDRVMNEKGK